MNATLQTESELFESGPFPHFQKTLGLFRPLGLKTSQRMLLVALVGWVPVVLLLAAEGAAGQETKLHFFFQDIAVNVRSLVAAPLFILAESITLPRLERIASHFLYAGFVMDPDRPLFDRALASTKRLLNSTIAEVLAIALAYVVIISLVRFFPTNLLPAWYLKGEAGSPQLSLAAWWYVFVSLPVLLILLFGWLWRVLLWGRFLLLMSRLNLRLVAAHPDRAAGLKFLDNSIFAFMPVAFTIGVIVAGVVANRVLRMQVSQTRLQNTIIALTIIVLILFVGPLLVFVVNLSVQRRSGILRYGALAGSLGHEFEQRWLASPERVGQEALEAPDFSATTDLYQVVSGVYEINGLPFDLKTVVALISITLAPLMPVALLAIPLMVLLKEVVKLLL